ncbi:MAG: hypothetical protein COT84_00230 [Chlamydiae bacterium CG10_big_fil_rev_8_21_14_0_10_35_9]|nr:MAG: hypothetical protein COT84_00230 [Chlamydiae bacterium CG10_big_fil_rev_8_21_14_0_10_35_9]
MKKTLHLHIFIAFFRSKSYIEYGLGQAKLQVEHWKKALENEPKRELTARGKKYSQSKILKSEACSNIQQWIISEILKTFGEEPSKKES